MIQRNNLTFKTDTDLARGRYVTITPSTDKVAYATAAGSADGITIGESDNSVVSVQLLSDTSASYFVEAEETISLGHGIEVGTDGKAASLSAGTEVGIAKTAGINGSFVTGYKI